MDSTGISSLKFLLLKCLARALLPAIQKLFEAEEGEKEFEQWRAERRKSKLNKKNDNIKSDEFNGLPQ